MVLFFPSLQGGYVIACTDSLSLHSLIRELLFFVPLKSGQPTVFLIEHEMNIDVVFIHSVGAT